MTNRLLALIIRLKTIFLRIEEREQETRGNEKEISALNIELASVKKDQADAMKALDDLEKAIKKWE